MADLFCVWERKSGFAQRGEVVAVAFVRIPLQIQVAQEADVAFVGDKLFADFALLKFCPENSVDCVVELISFGAIILPNAPAITIAMVVR